jgi:hypothetical protein
LYISSINENNSENEQEPVPAKRKVEAKLVQNNKKQRVDLGDTYFVDKLVELEEKRIMDQTKLERERMEHERKAREDQLAFQREILAMMQQQFQKGYATTKTPSIQPVLTSPFCNASHLFS